jgi:hypothetical protein
MLLRWHIRFPSRVIHRGVAGEAVRQVLARAVASRPRLNWQTNPSQWTNAHEATLLEELRSAVDALRNNELSETIPQVENWPSWVTGRNTRHYALDPTVGRLSEARNSFRFDDAGMPAAPY